MEEARHAGHRAGRAKQQDSLRRLLALEATPGPVPPGVLLDISRSRLVPCDCIVVSLSDSTGCVVDHVMLVRHGPPDGPTRRSATDRSCSGWCTRGPTRSNAEMLRHFGCHRRRHARLQVRTGPRRPALDGSLRPDVLGGRPGHAADDHPRRSSDCCASDPDARLPPPSRRRSGRVLQLRRDRRVQRRHRADLYISVSTVRKHLEHAYRKLGVTAGWPPCVAAGAGACPASVRASGSPRGLDEYA